MNQISEICSNLLSRNKCYMEQCLIIFDILCVRSTNWTKLNRAPKIEDNKAAIALK